MSAALHLSPKARLDPRITKMHGGEKRWRTEYAALRRLCLVSGLNETMKWGQACYELDGHNVVLIHGFKDYCALLFIKGALLKDPQAILIQQSRNTQSARQIRFTSLADIRRHKANLQTYIAAAITVERSGAKVKMKDVAQFDVPQEFQRRLDHDPTLAGAFRSLTPGRQKSYLLYFGAAKLPATRSARIRKHESRILQGLGLND